MTTVIVEKRNERIVRVTCDGHTGYGIEGEDIVCAALSSVVQTALMGLLRIACIAVKYEVDEEEGYLSIELPEDLTERERDMANIILDTMLLGVMDLHEGYSDFIELEVI